MKKFKYQFAFISLFICCNLFAQDLDKYPESIIKIETNEGIGDGYFFMFELTKDKVNYTAIVVPKSIVKDSPFLKFYFKNLNGNQSILIIKNNKELVIEDTDQENDFILIPFGNLRTKLEEQNIKKDQVFLCENFIPKLNSLKSKSDIAKLKAIWESKFINNF